MAVPSGVHGNYNFRCRKSPLNPLMTKPVIGLKPGNVNTNATTKSTTRLHLANLEKLLQKPTSLDPQPSPPQIEPNDMSFENKGIGILEGFQLTRIWPDTNAVVPDEMSPRGLNSLQNLLSKTPEYSPRNHLGSRWREYHGSNDWEGLLDPLDENLRRELVRCGEFVQTAYHAFNANPATSANESPLPREVTLPDKSYKVTKSLYATASINLPKLIDNVVPNLDWMTQRSSWIGYVAICDDQREIQRMGRRDIVIALRGTATCLEWAENLRAQLIPIPSDEKAPNLGLGQPKVECGFLSLLKTSGAHVPSLAESVTEEVKRLIEKYKGETLSITVTGHSLGAALAVLVAEELSTCAPNIPPLAVFSFGGPRVGNQAFADTISAKNVKVLRIVNNQDLITKVPGMFLNEGLEQKLRGIKIEGLLEDNMPWDYSHVGSELRVDTKMSPYLKPNADVACCHDLEAYLHLVDGFSSSDCPFRANAKRSLLKLLHEQESNVKKLYSSKAKSLNLNIETKGLPRMSPCLPSPS